MMRTSTSHRGTRIALAAIARSLRELGSAFRRLGFALRRAIAAATFVTLSFLLTGCTVARVANAWLQSKRGFAQCTSDARILCEPGSEELARAIAPLLPDAIAKVEAAQLARFSAPIEIFTFASRETFAAHSGAVSYAEGAVSLQRLNLSPKLLSTPERMKAIVTHELSHLHLQLRMGSIAWARLPGWFHEGLATFVSGGGGAETVSADAAAAALIAGRRFQPDSTQSLLFPKNASSYGITPHLYYREAALFVRYMRTIDPAAFDAMLRAIEEKVAFPEAVESSYHAALPALWSRFLESLKPT